MSASHHPSEDLLLGYASGSLDEPSSVLIATHLALCPSCRRVVASAEEVGGSFLDDIEPASVSASGLEDILARLDSDDDDQTEIVVSRPEPVSNLNADLPRPLRDYVSGRLGWRWLGPGVHYAAISENASGAKMGLLRIAPGTRVPNHGHSGEELTMVLAGGYSDATGSYQRGDIEIADQDLTHQPVADADEECVCLIVTQGAMLPTGLIAKMIQPFVRV